MKENWKQTDFATGYHIFATPCNPLAWGQKGLKQGPFTSSQHGSVLMELMR